MADYSHKDQNIGTLPVLPVADVESTVDFYVNKLGFEEKFRQQSEGGDVVNAQVHKEGCNIMLNHNPSDAGRAGGGIYLWIRLHREDIDSFFERVQANGVSVIDEIRDQFWGDRAFSVRDCNGFALAFNKSIPRD